MPRRARRATLAGNALITRIARALASHPFAPYKPRPLLFIPHVMIIARLVATFRIGLRVPGLRTLVGLRLLPARLGFGRPGVS